MSDEAQRPKKKYPAWTAERRAKQATTYAAKKAAGLNTWTPEHRAKHEATIAAKRAAGIHLGSPFGVTKRQPPIHLQKRSPNQPDFSKNPRWGGPARGPGSRFNSTNQPTREHVVAKMAEARTAAEAARPHAVAMVGVWKEVALDKKAPPQARVIAADKLVERAEGKPVQPVITAQAREPVPFDMGLLSPEEQELFDKVLLKIAHKSVVAQIESHVAPPTEDEGE